MKKIVVFLLACCVFLCGNVSAADETTLNGIINEVYITDGMRDKVQCLVLTLDEEKTFDIYDDMGDIVHIKTNEIQLSSNDYKSEMNGKRVTVKGNDLFQGLTYYYIRPVMMLNAKIEAETSAEEVSVIINDEPIEFDQPPILKNGRTFVPIRKVAEKLGANVIWDNSSQCATINSDSGNIQLYIDYAAPIINGVRTIIDAAPFVENGRTLVPVRLVAQALGADVVWNGENRSVVIDNRSKTDESIYKEYKANPDLPIIFSSSESSGDGNCKIPQLNLKNSDLVNSFDKQISEKLRQEMDYAYNISYSYTINGDILSVVASVMSEEEFYYTLNFDIKSGKEISYADLCKIIHLSEDEYINNVRTKCISSFDIMYPASKINNMGITEEFYNKQRNIAGSNKCFSESSPWFIGSDKAINVIVYFPGLAGGDYLHAIDTGIII